VSDILIFIFKEKTENILCGAINRKVNWKQCLALSHCRWHRFWWKKDFKVGFKTFRTVVHWMCCIQLFSKIRCAVLTHSCRLKSVCPEITTVKTRALEQLRD